MNWFLIALVIVLGGVAIKEAFIISDHSYRFNEQAVMLAYWKKAYFEKRMKYEASQSTNTTYHNLYQDAKALIEIQQKQIARLRMGFDA